MRKKSDKGICLSQIQVHWFKDGAEIKKGKKYDIISKGAVRILVINKCLLDDEAEYSCEVRTARTSGMLTVLGKTEVFLYRCICIGEKNNLQLNSIFVINSSCRRRSCLYKESCQH